MPVEPAEDVTEETEKSPDQMRLQKFLAMAGVDSRRNCEEYIRTGRVTVDGEVITDPARGIDPKTQDIKLDAERLRPPRQPCVRLIQPTDQHWAIFQTMLRSGNAVANLVSDAHLAALAVEHNCVLHSTDADFARFRGLKWENPLADK